jgi:hypothetical protein
MYTIHCCPGDVIFRDPPPELQSLLRELLLRTDLRIVYRISTMVMDDLVDAAPDRFPHPLLKSRSSASLLLSPSRPSCFAHL